MPRKLEFVTERPTEPDDADYERWRFFGSLRASGLLQPETVDCLEGQAMRQSMDALRRMLLVGGILTPYQLDRITDGQADGLVLGQYRILDEIGAGGFGRVYKANHALMGRLVALKVMSPGGSDGDSFRDIFRSEIAATTQLNHPNVVTTYDAVEIDGRLIMAMEYVNGPSLDGYLRRHGPPPVPVACTLVLNICLGLQHAHDIDIVHRDVKPANILVPGFAAGGRIDPACPALAKVIDFGLSRLRCGGGLSANTLPAGDGALIGTPAFIAPEQAMDFHKADSRSDLYSLGCTMYVLLTGVTPFTCSNIGEMIGMHLSKTPRPIRDLRAEVPVGLAAIVKRLMAKKPSDRFQSAAEVASALGSLVLSDAWSAPGKASPTPRSAADDTAVMPLSLAPRPEPADCPVESAAAERRTWRTWRTWSSVLESHRHGEPLGVTDAEYDRLYKSLIRGLRVPGGSDPDRRARLQTLVEPWVTLRAIRTLDAAACGALLDELGRADPSLGQTTPASGWNVPALTVLLGLCA